MSGPTPDTRTYFFVGPEDLLAAGALLAFLAAPAFLAGGGRLGGRVRLRRRIAGGNAASGRVLFETLARGGRHAGGGGRRWLRQPRGRRSHRQQLVDPLQDAGTSLAVLFLLPHHLQL